MRIIIAATKTCTHRPKLEEQLRNAGLKYELQYFENHSELIEVYNLKTSPLLIVNEKVVSVGMPRQEKITEIKNRES